MGVVVVAWAAALEVVVVAWAARESLYTRKTYAASKKTAINQIRIWFEDICLGRILLGGDVTSIENTYVCRLLYFFILLSSTSVFCFVAMGLVQGEGRLALRGSDMKASDGDTANNVYYVGTRSSALPCCPFDCCGPWCTTWEVFMGEAHGSGPENVCKGVATAMSGCCSRGEMRKDQI